MRNLEDLRDLILAHGEAEAPREACGVVVLSDEEQDLVYLRCRNVAPGANQFMVDPDDLASAARVGEIRAIVHTHVNAPPTPSPGDRRGCYRAKLPYAIVSVPEGAMAVLQPAECQPTPLVGRTFQHGVMDCYTIIQDYYAQELGIELPDVAREDKWWEQGLNLYVDAAEANGFRMLGKGEAPRRGDVALFTFRTAVPSHAAVFVSSDVILHHLPSRLSARVPYHGVWPQVLYGIYRHRQMELS